MLRLLSLFIYLLLVIVCLAFAALNANLVSLKLYWVNLELPLAFIMVVCFGAGMLLGAILFLGKYIVLSRAYHQANHQVNILEKEVYNLRAIPIQDAH